MTSIQNIRKEIKAQNLDIQGVCEWLEKYGSDQDPIVYMGEEMDARTLSYKLAEHTPALDVRISFYGTIKRGGTGLRRNSNFACMLKDRIDLFNDKERTKAKQERQPIVRYIVTWKEYSWHGKAHHKACSKTFITRTEAKAHFVYVKKMHEKVRFRKMTDELLGESND